MRACGTHIVAALLVGVLTVLAPDGALSIVRSEGALTGASAAASVADTAGRVDPVPAASGVAASVSPASGTVKVTVTVVKQSTPPPREIIPIYRFYSPRSGTHFYTPSAEERDMVIARWPDVWHFEGVAYTIDPARNSQPLYRFYNYVNGSHFYTASAVERDTVLARWGKVFHYDGPTYAVTPYPEAGKTPVYRFYNKKNGSHFYTADEAEKNHVIAAWPDIYQLEGTAFWLGQ